MAMPLPPMGGKLPRPSVPNAPQPELDAEAEIEPGMEEEEGIEGLDPEIIAQLMELLGVDPDAPEEDIMGILEMIMSGEGVEPEAAPPDLGGAAARRLGGGAPPAPMGM